MPFIPNRPSSEVAPKKGVPEDFVAWPFVDELFDYTSFLQQNNTIATFPQSTWGTEVAVVGAGPAGMLAAFELLKAGLTPIVFEASGRIGGRNWSQYFGDCTDVFAEMGAMRVPTENQVFWHYATDVFGLQTGTFPDPGVVDTVLYYENQVYPWPGGTNPPGPFSQIADAFDAFTGPLMQKIYSSWGNWPAVQSIWQAYVNQYRNTSFYEALVEGIPTWTTEDLNAFGALGMGSGGFGPLYGVGFLELLRILVNQFEQDQQLLVDGISGLTDGFYSTMVTQPNGQQVSLASLECVKLDSPVEQIQWSELDSSVTVQWGGQNPGEQSFPAVIVATTTRAMELLGLTMALPQNEVNSVMTEPVKVGIRNLHLMESSKLFIRTETKFWKDGSGIPQVILTDELPRAAYCLDYPQTDNGVVLISYTWGDDSAKLLALRPAERLKVFREVLTIISPPFAEALVPLGGDNGILNVDWEAEPGYYGAFKLQDPGQDANAQAVFFQYLSVLDETDRGVYLAGDSVSWAGGWTEGALHTGLNAACAVASRLGGTLPQTSPLGIDPNMYDYSTGDGAL
jgi:tryptophan 2-monooxygenase